MTDTVDITPHPALGVAYQCVQALQREGFRFLDENGDDIEGLALVTVAGVLMAHEAQGRLAFGIGLDRVLRNLAPME